MARVGKVGKEAINGELPCEQNAESLLYKRNVNRENET